MMTAGGGVDIKQSIGVIIQVWDFTVGQKVWIMYAVQLGPYEF